MSIGKPEPKGAGGMRKIPRVPVVVQMLAFMTLGNLNNSSYSPLDTFIKSTYSLSSTEVGVITSVVFIGAFIISLLSGFLVDRLGPNTAIKISFSIIATGSAVIFFSVNYPGLLAGYFLIGFGYGTMVPATNSAMMKEYYPHHARGMGVKQSGVPIGAALSVGILPVIALTFSLKASFLVMILIATTLAIITPRERLSPSRTRIGKGYIRDLLSASKNKSLLSVEIGVVFLSWGQQTLLTFFVIFEETRGIPVLLAEVLLIVLFAGSVFGRNFWAMMSDRIFRSNRVHTLSLIMAISGALFLVFILEGSYYPVAVLLSFFLGMNAVGWNSAYVTVISEIAPRNKVGLFSGVSIMFTGLGTIIGTPISGKISDLFAFSNMWLVLGSSLLVMSVVFLFAAGKFVGSIKSEPNTQ